MLLKCSYNQSFIIQFGNIFVNSYKNLFLSKPGKSDFTAFANEVDAYCFYSDLD